MLLKYLMKLPDNFEGIYLATPLEKLYSIQ